jgi:TrkA domain protein
VRDLEVALEDLAIEWIDVPATSPLVGLTVATCRIRSTTGSSVIAILRKGGAMAMPHPDEVVQAGDTLVIIGRPEQFGAIQRLVAEGPPK